MNVNQVALSALRTKRDKLQFELNGIVAAIAALGGGGGTGEGKQSKGAPRKRRRKQVADASGLTPIQKAQQARSDSVAVAKGTATPEQVERHNARVAAKAGNTANQGASLVPAAD